MTDRPRQWQFPTNAEDLPDNERELLALRREIETALEHLIDLLDKIDGDADHEDDCTAEPVLGWTLNNHHITNEMTRDGDREDDDEREEDHSDDEAWLGWNERGHMGSYADYDLEVNGDEQEPNCGWPEKVKQLEGHCMMGGVNVDAEGGV